MILLEWSGLTHESMDKDFRHYFRFPWEERLWEGTTKVTFETIHFTQTRNWMCLIIFFFWVQSDFQDTFVKC
jgi:hypothetical protein